MAGDPKVQRVVPVQRFVARQRGVVGVRVGVCDGKQGMGGKHGVAGGGSGCQYPPPAHATIRWRANYACGVPDGRAPASASSAAYPGRESGHCSVSPLARNLALLSFLLPTFAGAGAMRGAGAPSIAARSAYKACNGSGVSSQPM
ncbi:hypothetical protein D3C72_1988840 [compost metagenome]